ncbi:MAG: hypothetical protein J5851_02060 [Oscillospiraceae bacterium]|nr:hypothetical protein [Oscillospiraceae bacterium]
MNIFAAIRAKNASVEPTLAACFEEDGTSFLRPLAPCFAEEQCCAFSDIAAMRLL